jgi:hypothetical protein
MALAVDRANLLVDAMSSRMTPVRDALLLVGLYYTSKKVYGGLYNIYTACKTFGLPYIWPRNFPQEYGQWAGKALKVAFSKSKYSLKALYSCHGLHQRYWPLLCSRIGQAWYEYYLGWEK